jgi:hypothetical protein
MIWPKGSPVGSTRGGASRKVITSWLIVCDKRLSIRNLAAGEMYMASLWAMPDISSIKQAGLHKELRLGHLATNDESH